MEEMERRLCDAIRGRKVLTVSYKDLIRVVEPYLLYESKNGAVILHAWQVSGDYEKTPPPDWCNMTVEDIDDATPSVTRTPNGFDR